MSTTLLQIRHPSSVLGFGTNLTVVAPSTLAGGTPPGVLYLLHGYSDDDSIWLRRTSLERYLERRNLLVVMPAVHLSFYADMAQGQAYNTYVAEELPAFVRRTFRTTSSRSRTFVAGLSMGGYGAMRLAFEHPDRFGAAASFSGALDVAAKTFTEPGVFRDQMVRVFGDLGKLKGSRHDLMKLASGHAKAGTRLPRLYACCGTEDFLYGDNQLFRQRMAKLGIPLTYEESAGAHDWAYWDRMLPRVLEWMDGPERV